MIIPALTFLLGLACGAMILWITRPKPRAPVPLVEIVTLVTRACHDLRGAVSPALLMVERLESHGDENVRHAAGVIAEALDRTAKISRATSATVKKHLSGS